MIGKLSITALAAIAAVNGSPLNKRQGVTSAVESAVSSAASSAAASVTSAASGATSAAASATSAVSSGVASATTAVSSAVSSASGAASTAVGTATSAAAIPTTTANATGTAGNPAFPCPPGFLLTYVEQNATVGQSISTVGPALGEWASSPIFPNVTMPMMGNEVGATHTLNIAGLSVNEVLVNSTMNMTSGYVSWAWNLTNGPIAAPGATISNWTAQLNVYDPAFESTQMIGNETTAIAFVNFCASNQEAGSALLDSVLQLYLGNAAMALSGGNMTAPPAAATTAMETASMMSSMASSAAQSATSAASSAASSVASSASGVAASATSAAASAASSVVGAATTTAA